MEETFLELIQSVQSDLTIGDESSFIPLDTVKRAVNRAYVNKVSAIFKWPQTEDAKETSTKENREYYDYPDRWRPNSIWKLLVDGIDYGKPLIFVDYQDEIENSYPSGYTKIWSNKALRFFIRPIPTSNGSFNIEVHGQRIPTRLVSNGDMTIFSLNMPELNEAIVLEAKAILKSKGEEENSSEFASTEAKQICITAWKKLQTEQAKYQRTQPQFIVRDFFGNGGGNSANIGNFDIERR